MIVNYNIAQSLFIFKNMEYNNYSAISFEVDGIVYLYDRFSNEFIEIDKDVEKVLSTTDNAIQNDLIKDLQDNFDILRPFKVDKLSISGSKTTLEKIHSKIDGHVSKLVFSTTENCNLRCKYCVYSGEYYGSVREHNNNNLLWRVAQQAVDLFLSVSKNSTDRYISFYGGEALLNYSLIEKIVNYTKEKNREIKFGIVTNLVVLTDKIAKFLVDNEFAISVSLDGPETIHDLYRLTKNEKKTHKAVIKNLKMLRSLDEENFLKKIIFNILIVPHKYNLNILDEYFSSDLFKDIPLESFKVLQLNYEDNGFFEKYDYQDFIKRFNKFSIDKFFNALTSNKTDFSDMRISYNYNIKPYKRIYFREMNRMTDYSFFWPNGICIPGLRSIFVSTNGKIYPCEKMYDHNSLIIGDVFVGMNLNQIATIIDEYCKKSLNTCSNCWAFRFCEQCYLNSRKGDQYSNEKHQQSCETTKKSMLFYFKNYLSIINKNPNAFEHLDQNEQSLRSYDMILDD